MGVWVCGVREYIGDSLELVHMGLNGLAFIGDVCMEFGFDIQDCSVHCFSTRPLLLRALLRSIDVLLSSTTDMSAFPTPCSGFYSLQCHLTLYQSSASTGQTYQHP